MKKNHSAGSPPSKHGQEQCGRFPSEGHVPPDGDKNGDAQWPPIVADPVQRYLPFSLTDIQQAYWIGRGGSFQLGHVSIHRYMELEKADLDLERLNRALQRLIEHHDMLRAVILPEGQQQVLEKVPPYRMEIHDLRGQDPGIVTSHLNAIRQQMSHQVLPSDRWPLFDMCATRLDDRIRLHLSFDALIMDARSRNRFFLEWAELYNTAEANVPTSEISFRDFVLADVALKQTDIYCQARDYWCKRIPELPPRPDLPIAVQPTSIARPRFRRFQRHLDARTWISLKERAAKRGFRPTLLLLAAYAEMLRAWSKTTAFSINLSLVHRMARDPRLDNVIGLFSSVILIAIDNADCKTFEARARHIQNQVFTDLKHSAFSGVQVIREIIRQGESETEAVMPVVFTSSLSTDDRFRESEPTAWLGEKVYEITQTPQVWLDHQVYEKAETLELVWDVVEELFPQGMINDMFNAYCQLLHRLAKEERSWQASWLVAAETLMTPDQLELRSVVNDTEAPLPDALLHTPFATQVPKRPAQPAVIAPDRTLTYEELHKRANRIGHTLRHQGARPNRLVAVVMEKGWEQVVAVLGVLFSGAAYLPIDPGLPQERWRFLLEDGDVELLVTTPALDKTLDWPEEVKRVCVEEDVSENSDESTFEKIQSTEDLAYVIYTSGSTGQPKGVMITHQGAVNTILDINRRFGVGPGDRVLALSSLSFDLSVYDIFGTLAAGGTIVLPEKKAARDPAYLAEISRREKITVWNSVPAIMVLLEEYLTDRNDVLSDSLRLVLMSGDWIPVWLPDRIRRLASGVDVISLGGATEASIWSIMYPIGSVDPAWTSIPYGRPMANQRVYVLDESLAPRPVWVPGHIHIGGAGLAAGYWHDEEKTRASFISHPRTGERLYRTGDMGRYLPDGNIEFLGREDYQVKIQGFRVELGEIEAALKKHRTVREAIVTAVGQDQEEKRLIASIVPNPDFPFEAGELRRFLEQKIPGYMIPAQFVPLKHLPLTPGGKIDRKALPALEISDVTAPSQSSGELEDLVIQIKQSVLRVLNIDRLDPNTNLLNAGATSIDMIRIANRLESDLGFRPKLDEFYRRPSAAGLADLFEKHRGRGRFMLEERPRIPESFSGSTPFSSRLILDPEAREAFKAKQPSLRPRDHKRPFIPFEAFMTDNLPEMQVSGRRSHRHFEQTPLPLARFGRLAGCLRQTEGAGAPKYDYGSAGGMYPVQTYFYIKPGRLESVPSGIYYFHPVDNGLVQLSTVSELDREIYDPLINRPIFDEAAFSIFLIAQMKAIVPMYGDMSKHYATIEAGLMTQLLELSAPSCGIGLCQVGDIEFGRIRHHFELEESHVLVHSLLGGLLRSTPEHDHPPLAETRNATVESRKDWEEGKL